MDIFHPARNPGLDSYIVVGLSRLLTNVILGPSAELTRAQTFPPEPNPAHSVGGGIDS